MTPIDLGDIKNATRNVSDDARLRLNSSGDTIKTARKGFRGRVVKQYTTRTSTLENSKALLGNLLAGLKEKYGDRIGTQAYLAARPLAIQPEDDDQKVRDLPSSELTTRQVRAALAHAEANQREDLRTEALQQASPFMPGGDRFAEIAARANADPETLSQDQLSFFKDRLQEQVSDNARCNGATPSTMTIRDMAERLMRFTAGTVGDDAARRNDHHASAALQATRLLNVIENLGNPSMDDFADDARRYLKATHELVHDAAMKDDGGWGSDDLELANTYSLERAVGVAYRQETDRWKNNRAKNSYLPFRRRERAMLRFRRMRNLQKFAFVHASVFNPFNSDRHLDKQQNFIQSRSAALNE